MRIFDIFGLSPEIVAHLKNNQLNSREILGALNWYQLNHFIPSLGKNALDFIAQLREDEAFLQEETEELQNIEGTREPIHMGAYSLNSLLNGEGLEPNNLYLFYGQFRTGKSQIAHQVTVNCFRAYQGEETIRVIYIDPERTFRPTRLFDMSRCQNIDGEALLRYIELYQPRTIDAFEMILPQIQEYCEANPVRLIVIDSINHHFREALGDPEISYFQVKRILKKILKTLQEIARTLQIPVYITTPVSCTSKDDVFYEIRPVLGQVLSSYISHWIFLTEKTAETPDLQTNARLAYIVKSPNLPEQVAEFLIERDGIRDT